MSTSMSLQYARGEGAGGLNDSQSSTYSGGGGGGGGAKGGYSLGAYGPPLEDVPGYSGELLHRDHKDFTQLHGGKVTRADKPAYMHETSKSKMRRKSFLMGTNPLYNEASLAAAIASATGGGGGDGGGDGVGDLHLDTADMGSVRSFGDCSR
jgi:hypothetical protein